MNGPEPFHAVELGRSRADAGAAPPLDSPARIDRLIAKVDALLAEQLDAILHHPEFQALESAWRGLKFVVDRVDFTENIRVHLWNCPKEELRADLEDNLDRTKSHLYRAVYTREYGQHGGEPYAAIFASFSIDSSPNDPAVLVRDIALLRGMASVAAMAHAPVFIDASPALVGLTGFEELAAMSDVSAVFEHPRLIGWNALRDTEDARYLGILLPRMLLRLPYGDEAEGAESFIYNEHVANTAQHLWGSATYAFAVRLGASHARFRTAMGLLGTSDDEPPARDWHAAMNQDACKPPVEIVLSRRLETALSGSGFIPLTCDPIGGALRFSSANSLQRPKSFSESQATLNYFLGSQIPYLLFVSRFVHFVKVMQREHLGGHHTADELQREMTDWLRRYVNRAESPPASLRFRFPLRSALVEVSQVEGEPGWYAMNIFIVPHMRYKGAEFELSLPGRIERR